MENQFSQERKNSEVIVVTSGKGGVGKTTTTANVGTGLAKLGKKVCLIDTDIGLRNPVSYTHLTLPTILRV